MSTALPPSRRRPPRARPIDRAWPALPLAAVGITVLVVLAAVLLRPARSPSDQVRDAVADLAQDVQRGRGEAACARLTVSLRSRLGRRTGLPCADAVRTFGVGVDAGLLRASRLEEVVVAGDRATVARTEIRTPGGQPFSSGLQLQRERGAWLLAALTR